MKTLLAIISAPMDNELLKRNWPYLTMQGWDILGAGTAGGGCEWPKPITARIDTGIIGKRQTPAGSSLWGLVQQEADAWKWFLAHPEYDSICVVEPDGIFTRKLPPHPGGAYLFSVMPNFSRAGLFKSSVYAQTPRWSDRPTTEKLLRYTERAIQENDTEFWISDRLPAYLCYKHRIKFQPIPAWSPFAMTHWDAKSFDEQWVHDARMAIKLGAAYIHACKTEAQLNAIKDLLWNQTPN